MTSHLKKEKGKSSVYEHQNKVFFSILLCINALPEWMQKPLQGNLKTNPQQQEKDVGNVGMTANSPTRSMYWNSPSCYVGCAAQPSAQPSSLRPNGQTGSHSSQT